MGMNLSYSGGVCEKERGDEDANCADVGGERREGRDCRRMLQGAVVDPFGHGWLIGKILK